MVAQRGYAWHVKQTTGEHLLVPYGGLCNGVVGNAREGKPKEIAEERRHVQRLDICGLDDRCVAVHVHMRERLSEQRQQPGLLGRHR